jgi:gluconate 2-dehydrogenase gamma chain
MHRREILRLLSATAITPMISPDLYAMLRQAQPSSSYRLQTLDAHQNETVVAMMDLIIPATDTPGAKEAKVNEFVDVILTGWATPAERDRLLAGLGDVDRLSGTLFSKKFVEASTEQQTALLRSLDDAVDWAHGPDSNEDGDGSIEYDMRLRGEFFRVFKTLTLYGYYTSEIGFTQELKKEIIPGAQHGCVPLPAGKRA